MAIRPVRRAMYRLIPLEYRHVLWMPPQGLAYIRVPKAANSSIRSSLAKCFDMPKFDDLNPANDKYWRRVSDREATVMTPAAYSRRSAARQSWCFSFVRHPVARLYSCWNNKIIENKELTPGFVDMGLIKGMSFDDFVERVSELPDEYCDLHIRSQASILLHRGKVVPDFVGRLEHIEEDWQHVRYEIQVRCGRDVGPLMQRNVRGRVGADANGTLSANTEDMIRERFARDFEIFYPD